MSATATKFTVVNRIDNDKVESNLCYPMGKNYRQICKLDKQAVLNKIREKFNASDIANKYAIDIDGKLYYKHDDSYYLIEAK
jgi:hypothetical protein